MSPSYCDCFVSMDMIWNSNPLISSYFLKCSGENDQVHVSWQKKTSLKKMVPCYHRHHSFMQTVFWFNKQVWMNVIWVDKVTFFVLLKDLDNCSAFQHALAFSQVNLIIVGVVCWVLILNNYRSIAIAVCHNRQPPTTPCCSVSLFTDGGCRFKNQGTFIKHGNLCAVTYDFN